MLGLFRSRSPEPATPFVDVRHAGAAYRVAIKRVARARRFTLKVRAATRDAVLTIPSRATLRAAHSFAERHAAWLGERLQALPRSVPFAVGSVIPFRGDMVAIVDGPGLRRMAYLDTAAGPEGGSRPVLRVSGTARDQHRRVVAFLQRAARDDIEAAVARHAAAVGRTVDTITLRDTRTRWGSCSSRGHLSFSWRLVMAPPYVLDYLAAHEVAHLVHLDHSAAYWAVARSLVPELARAEAWLKAHGTGLHRFGERAAVSGE